MIEVVYYVAASLDGFIATPDGGVGWLAPFEGSGEDYGYAEFYDSVDAVVVGSHTFEQALTFGEWPYPGKQTVVITSRPLTSGRPDVAMTGDAPERIVARLEREGHRRVWLVGGGALAGSFEAEGLIDAYIVSVMPVLLGVGVPLLGGHAAMQALRVTDVRCYPDGVTQITCAPTGRERSSQPSS